MGGEHTIDSQIPNYNTVHLKRIQRVLLTKVTSINLILKSTQRPPDSRGETVSGANETGSHPRLRAVWPDHLCPGP